MAEFAGVGDEGDNFVKEQPIQQRGRVSKSAVLRLRGGDYILCLYYCGNTIVRETDRSAEVGDESCMLVLSPPPTFLRNIYHRNNKSHFIA